MDVKEFVETYIRSSTPPEASTETIKVSGAVKLTYQSFENPIRIANFDFANLVDLSNCRFLQGLQFVNCIFRESLKMRGVFVQGSLDLRRCKVYRPNLYDFSTLKESETRLDEAKKSLPTFPYEAPPPWRTAMWDGMHILGAVRANQIEVSGNLNLAGSRIEGSLNLRGAKIGLTESGEQRKDGPAEGRLFLRQIHVSGDVDFAPYYEGSGDAPQRTMIFGTVSIGNSTILGRFNLRGIYIKECLHAIMLRLTGRMLADCWWGYRATLDPSADEKLPFRTHIGKITKPQDAAAPTGKSDSIATSPGNNPLDYDSELEISIYLQDARLGSAVWMMGIKAEGSMSLENAELGGELNLDVWERPKEKVGKKEWIGFKETPPEGYQRTELGRDYRQESIRLKDATVSSNVELRGLKTTGSIYCRNTKIDGSLRCCLFFAKLNNYYFAPEIGVDFKNRSLILIGETLDGNIEIGGATFEGGIVINSTVKGVLWGESGKPPRDEDSTLKLPDTAVGRTNAWEGISLYGSTIEGDVRCRGIIVKGPISFELARVKGSVHLQNAFAGELGATVDSDHDEQVRFGLSLKSATVANHVRLDRVEVRMGVDADGLRAGGNLVTEELKSFNFDEKTTIQDKTGLKEWRPRRFGRIDLAGANIGGHWIGKGMILDESINAPGITVKGKIELQELKSSLRARHEGEEQFSVNLADADVTSNVNFSDSGSKMGSSQGFVVLLNRSRVLGEVEISGRALEDAIWNFKHARLGGLHIDFKGVDAVKTTEFSLLGTALGALELPILPPHKPLARQTNVPAHIFLPGRFLSFLCAGLIVAVLTFDQSSIPKHIKQDWGEYSLSQSIWAMVLICIQRLYDVGKELENCPFTALVKLSLAGLVSFVWWDTSRNTFHPFGRCARKCAFLFGDLLGTIAIFLIFAALPPIPHNPLRAIILFISDLWHQPAKILLWIAVAGICWAWFTFSTRSFFTRPMEVVKSWVSRLRTRFPSVRKLVRLFSALKRKIFPSAKKQAAKKEVFNKESAFLALCPDYAPAPYLALRQILERDGKKLEAEDVFFQMRRRELLEKPLPIWSILVTVIRYTFFVVAGSGVKIRDLCIFITCYFIFSWLAVFSNPDSVEHPSTYVVPVGLNLESPNGHAENKYLIDDLVIKNGQPSKQAWQNADKNGISWPYKVESALHEKAPNHAAFTAEEEWGLKDGFWMALKVHVPLLPLWAKRKWEPSASPGWYYSLRGMQPMWFGMEYETYALIAQIISFLTIPMLIAAVRNLMYKGPETAAFSIGEGGEEG